MTRSLLLVLVGPLAPVPIGITAVVLVAVVAVLVRHPPIDDAGSPDEHGPHRISSQ